MKLLWLLIGRCPDCHAKLKYWSIDIDVCTGCRKVWR